MTSPRVVVDLEADFLEKMRADLKRWGIDLPAVEMPIQEVGYIYWNAWKRLIPVRPRIVHLARNFMLPTEKADREGLMLLIGMFHEGHNVNGHLSERIASPKAFPKKGEKHKPDPFHDQLLNQWGINHFHLGDIPEGGGFVERTSMLLFAMVRPDDVYFIDVLPHGNWTRQDLLERVHMNWPELIAHWKQVHEDRGTQFTPEQMKVLRKKNYNAPFQAADGTVYLPPGGGVVAAGISFEVVQWTNISLGMLSRYTEDLRVSGEVLADALRKAGKDVPEVIELKLEIDDQGEVIVFAEALHHRFGIGPLFPRPQRAAKSDPAP